MLSYSSEDRQWSAVIVNHNNATTTYRCIASLKRWHPDIDIVVVDNSSDRQAMSDPHLKILRVQNRGYGSAINVGVQHARGNNVLFLNPDVVIVEPLLPTLSRALEAEDAALAAPLLTGMNGEWQSCWRRIPSISSLFASRIQCGSFLARVRRWYLLTDTKDRGTVAEFALGGCLAAKRDAFLGLGGFDEGYFLYFEDVDLCVRVRRAGLSLRLCDSVRALHSHRRESRHRAYLVLAHIRSAIRFYCRYPEYIWRSTHVKA